MCSKLKVEVGFLGNSAKDLAWLVTMQQDGGRRISWRRRTAVTAHHVDGGRVPLGVDWFFLWVRIRF